MDLKDLSKHGYQFTTSCFLLQVKNKYYCICGTIGGDLNLTVLAVLALITKFNVHQHWVLVKQSTLNVVLFTKLNVSTNLYYVLIPQTYCLPNTYTSYMVVTLIVEFFTGKIIDTWDWKPQLFSSTVRTYLVYGRRNKLWTN